ncbi:MAG: 2-C-methyl-D-erythritol 2,4-cyclodiphosphate synthase [Armatimonadetes bacterium]|nr:2-C-methyl-D-erythritol 2,4-cyclodiphosphate synthase [Armatimonadota bacterium]
MSGVTAIILAAGSSTRFGRDKLSELLDGKPVWHHSVRTFLDHPGVDEVVVVVAEDMVAPRSADFPDAKFVAGGNSRQQSALNGLRAAMSNRVLFHDAARPFVKSATVGMVIDALGTHRAAAPALPVTDTIKQKTLDGVVTLDRNTLCALQTPQGGFRTDFLNAYADLSTDVTDDLAVLESIGITPVFVAGDPENIKITHRRDLDTMEIRTGFGYDIHAFSQDPDRKMVLGGVEFDSRPGLEGHSDADALIHAIVDALLGAVGLGDIGAFYPPSDPQWKDRNSIEFLKETKIRLKELGWDVVNIDSSVIAERPKVIPMRDAIETRIADALQIQKDRVCVKATTNEKLGAIGRSEGIAAMAIATVRRR